MAVDNQASSQRPHVVYPRTPPLRSLPFQFVYLCREAKYYYSVSPAANSLRGLVAIHSIAGDMVSAPYLAPGVRGYELHVYPALVRRAFAEDDDGSHWLQAFAALRVVTDGVAPPRFAFTRSSPPAGAPLSSTSAGIADAINVLTDYKTLADASGGQDQSLADPLLAHAYSKTLDSKNDFADDIKHEIDSIIAAKPGAFSHHSGVFV